MIRFSSYCRYILFRCNNLEYRLDWFLFRLFHHIRWSIRLNIFIANSKSIQEDRSIFCAFIEKKKKCVTHSDTHTLHTESKVDFRDRLWIMIRWYSWLCSRSFISFYYYSKIVFVVSVFSVSISSVYLVQYFVVVFLQVSFRMFWFQCYVIVCDVFFIGL